MLGHYLLTLTEAQEDRVLMRHVQPGPYCAGCLIGVANDAPGAGVFWSEHGDQWQRRHDQPIPGQHLGVGGARRWNGDRLGIRYDYLCKRFGVERMNAAIRNRILSNRARRVLSGVPTPQEQPQ